MSIKATYIVPHPPLIIPNIGNGSEQQIKKTIESYEKIAKEIAEIAPDTIIISSPHAPMYSDYFYLSSTEQVSGDLSAFNAKEVSYLLDVDTNLVDEITSIAEKYRFATGKHIKTVPLDHGSIIPIYFINKYLSKYKIIIVGLSSLPLITNYQMGTIIKEAVNNLNRNVVFIASGDLSHKLKPYGPYGFASDGPLYDNKINEISRTSNFYELLVFKNSFLEKAAECGHRSFTIMAGCLDGENVISENLSYEDVTGVGYCISSFYPKDENEERKYLTKYLSQEENRIKKHKESIDDYVKLAYKSIENYILYHKKITVPSNINPMMLKEKSGVFITIYKHDTLRGCIGTISPTTSNIAEEIINNSINASTSDPRFLPITKDELKYLDISVSILKKPEFILTKDMLDVKKYGVIVSSGFKKGLLLPDINGIEDVDTQISIAMKKGDIAPEEEYTLQRFEVIKHQ